MECVILTWPSPVVPVPRYECASLVVVCPLLARVCVCDRYLGRLGRVLVLIIHFPVVRAVVPDFV